MKNLKVRNKLILSFAIVLSLTIVISIIAVTSLSSLDSAGNEMFSRNFVGTQKSHDILVNLTTQRSLYREIVLALDPESGTEVPDMVANLRASEQEIQAMIEDYDQWSTLVASKAAFAEFRTIYENKFKDEKELLIQYAQANDKANAFHTLRKLPATYAEMAQHLNNMVSANTDAANEKLRQNGNLFDQSLYIQLALLLATVVVVIIVTVYISTLIAKPLRWLSNTLSHVSTTGMLILDSETMRHGSEIARRKDEIGGISAAVESLLLMLAQKVTTLETVAGGDLTANIDVHSADDTIGNALQKMVGSLNEMFFEINHASIEVSNGSKQVADGSQALAQGSTEQAASVEELSASVGSVSSNTAQNAQLAREAATLSGEIKGNAEKGSTQMEHMMNAVKAINDASNSISKVIKVIDDIAFQTNILALNAAVEAARAGQHGKGFAVVAEEVRTLAGKSAEAAKDTGSMIVDSIEKAKLGYQIATETAASLKEIVDGIDKSAELIEIIATSSDEQAHAIRQINVGIDQVAQVVQQISSTAQESAAASEEMSSQSSLLRDLVARFKILEEGQAVLPGNAPRAIGKPRREPEDYDVNDGFGKY